MAKPDKKYSQLWKDFKLEGDEFAEDREGLTSMVESFSEINFQEDKVEQAKQELDKLLDSVWGSHMEIDDTTGKAYVPDSVLFEADLLWRMIREEEKDKELYGIGKQALFAKGYAPILGYMADLFLTGVPENLNATDSYILAGELVALTGQLEKLKGAGWAKVWRDSWAIKDKKGKRNEVRAWLKSYSKFKRKYLLIIKDR